jgi:cytochrome c oxidase cbb3-type subunit 1
MWDYVKLIVLGVVAVCAAIATNYARDLAFMVNAIELMLVAAIAFVVVLRGAGEAKVANSGEYMDGVIRWGVFLTAFWGSWASWSA